MGKMPAGASNQEKAKATTTDTTKMQEIEPLMNADGR